MAWLIHEPSLRAEVPVFCVQAVRPLLTNTSAPSTVAMGAVHLLLHLHSRLEVCPKKSVVVRDECNGSLCAPGSCGEFTRWCIRPQTLYL